MTETVFYRHYICTQPIYTKSTQVYYLLLAFLDSSNHITHMEQQKPIVICITSKNILCQSECDVHYIVNYEFCNIVKYNSFSLVDQLPRIIRPSLNSLNYKLCPTSLPQMI